MGFFSKMFGSYSDRELKSIYPIVDKIEAMADEYKAMSDAELQAKTPEFKTRLQSGETLLSTSEVSQIWPYFLSPGEDGYLFDIVSFEPDENGNPVIPSITGISYNVTYLPVDNAYASYDLSAVSEIEQDVSGDVSVVCRLTNSTDMDAYNPTVALGLYTDDGTMVYADGTTLQDVGIPAGGTVLVRFDVDDVFVKQWQSYGAMPTQANTNASFRKDED